MRTFDLRRVAAEAGVAERNARKWSRGERVSDNVACRLEAAARRVGVPLPASVAESATASAEPATGLSGAAPASPHEAA